MTQIQTELANFIDSSDQKAQLDAVAKNLIKHRIILAKILKECVEEFNSFSLNYIVKNCFAGEVHVDEISVDQDVLDADARIVGSDSEDASDSEGLIRYDIVFDAIVPDTERVIRTIINIEVQVDMNPGYAIITRAVYYLARLISRQKGTVFTNMDYQKIQKVYSIWICPDPLKKNVNSVAEYGFEQKRVIGHVDEPADNYDKMRAVIISLNDTSLDLNDTGQNLNDSVQNLNDSRLDSRSDIIRLLSALLSTSETVERRKQILEDEFHIPMTKEIEEEVQRMCNLGTAVEKKGIMIGEKRGEKQGEKRGEKNGIERTMLGNIKNLMESMKWTAKQAMDALKVPESEQGKYAAKL